MEPKRLVGKIFLSLSEFLVDFLKLTLYTAPVWEGATLAQEYSITTERL
jgi:hypothetical protein